MAEIEAHYAGVGQADESGTYVNDLTIGLYVDGELKAIGPQPEVLAKAMVMLGIKQCFEDDFMLGQETYAGAAKTLEEIRAFKAEKNKDQAEALREQAAEMLRKADELEGRTGGE